MKKVSVIIVNHNTREILEHCLENLQGIYEDMEVIVVDNASTDQTADMVKYKFPGVTLVETDNNGLAAGYNLGLHRVSGDYILLLGSDAFPEKDTIKGMVGYFEQYSDIGVATCKLILRTGKLDMDAHRGFPTPWASFTHFTKLSKLFPKSKTFDQYFLGWADMNVPHEIDLCISHFMLVRRKVFEDIGEFDEDFFVYGEDVDFCYRVKQKGWKIFYLPQWSAIHYKGVSVGIRKESADVSPASEETKRKMKVSSIEAMKIFYKKHYTDKYPKIVTWLVMRGIDLMCYLRS